MVIKTYCGPIDRADAVQRILNAALSAADPFAAVRRNLTRDGSLLAINERVYALNDFSAIYLAAIGKAAVPMAHAAAEILGASLKEGAVIFKHFPKNEKKKKNLRYIQASHPVPDERSLAAGKHLLHLMAKATAKDLVIFLISGGGSALITVPPNGIDLRDMQMLTDFLLQSGARIDEINTVRRALDQVKGGGLARAAAPAKTISLLLSDVIDSPPAAIASGPTVPNPTSKSDAFAVLEKYALSAKISPKILDFLQKDEVSRFANFRQENFLVIGDNRISALAARLQAEKEGFSARVLTTSLQGEAAEIGKKLGECLRNDDFSAYGASNISPPYCLIFGGETTVTLNAVAGRGGRNQELALAALKSLDGVKNRLLVTLATDGEDGPTDAAGAIICSETLARAAARGLDAAAYLRRHDAYSFFNSLGALLKIGATGTNVNDLTFVFAFSEKG